MIPIRNVIASFQQDSADIERYDVYKTDGDLSDSNGPHNRYIYLGGQLRLIASVWEKKFLGFKPSAEH